MESPVSCGICCLEYSEPETVPRVLDCGHSFCTSCITHLENKLCPMCSANIPCGKEFPVNYSLLSIVEGCKSEESPIDDRPLVSIMENLKENFNSRLSVINEIFGKKESIESDLRVLTSMEKEHLNEESGSKKEMIMRKKLRKLEEKYSDLSSANNYLYLDYFSSFLLKNSPSDNDFLKEIYKSLKNSDKVFTFKNIDKKIKFGELTVRDNKIMIHSLSMNEVPKGSKIVQFKNLKQGFRAKRFLPFIEITTKNSTSHTIIIEPHDTSLIPHFIKLCTAEKGPTYKNLTFSKGKNRTFYDNATGSLVLTLESILEVKIPEGLPLDYSKNNPKVVRCEVDAVIVTKISNDGFQLFRVKKCDNYSILGKVIYPLDLWNHVTCDGNVKILDCGIVTEV